MVDNLEKNNKNKKSTSPFRSSSTLDNVTGHCPPKDN